MLSGRIPERYRAATGASFLSVFDSVFVSNGFSGVYMRYCFFVIAVVVEFIFSAVSKSEEEEEEAEDEEGFGKSIKGGVVRVIQERTVER